jgi:hypothetical protein
MFLCKFNENSTFSAINKACYVIMKKYKPANLWGVLWKD